MINSGSNDKFWKQIFREIFNEGLKMVDAKHDIMSKTGICVKNIQ